MKQRLTSFDVPPEIPALDLDLSHAISSFKPGHLNEDDIPEIPVIKRNGKFRKYRRIVSLPLMKPQFSQSMVTLNTDKELPLPPPSSLTTLGSPLLTLEPLQSLGSPLKTSSELKTPPRPLEGRRSVTMASYRYSMPPLMEDDDEFYDLLQLKGNSGPGSAITDTTMSTGSTSPSKMSMDDVDSLFSDASDRTEDSDLAAKSLMEVVEIYNRESQEDLASTNLGPCDIYRDYEYNNSDDEDFSENGTESIYSSYTEFSKISSKFIEEPKNMIDDTVSVKDSLFSFSSEEPSIEVVDFKSKSTLSLNKDLPPSPTDSIQPEPTLALKYPTEPLMIKKARVNFETSPRIQSQPTEPTKNIPRKSSIRHRNSYSRPVSMYDHRSALMSIDAYRGVSNERPLLDRPARPISLYQPNASQSNVSTSSFMTAVSLSDAKSELKKEVRQRPFSFSLDTGEDYGYSRFKHIAPRSMSGNPYGTTFLGAKNCETFPQGYQGSSGPKSPERRSFLTPLSPQTPKSNLTPMTPPTPQSKIFLTTGSPPQTPPKDYSSTPLTPVSPHDWDHDITTTINNTKMNNQAFNRDMGLKIRKALPEKNKDLKSIANFLTREKKS